jgi:hypothetical protein
VALVFCSQLEIPFFFFMLASVSSRFVSFPFLVMRKFGELQDLIDHHDNDNQITLFDTEIKFHYSAADASLTA